MRYLNLGCGNRFHPDWENVDFQPAARSVRRHDLRTGIPYPDGAFDVVYHSHVLEHFPKRLALRFLQECHRVLKTRGIVRVIVPDLEQIARLYLEAFEKASRGEAGWPENYDWMVMEMYDQAVRESSGGSAIEFFRRDVIPNWDFVCRRWGAEAKQAIDYSRENLKHGSRGPTPLGSKLVYAIRNPAKFVRHKLLKLVLGSEDYQNLQVGRFRKQGEVHQWMYDGYSLAHLLREAGFRDAQRCTATESQIPDWAQYCLDNEADGTTCKPDSIFMEAVKP